MKRKDRDQFTKNSPKFLIWLNKGEILFDTQTIKFIQSECSGPHIVFSQKKTLISMN